MSKDTTTATTVFQPAPLGKEYAALRQRLETLDPAKKEEALEIAAQLRRILLESAKTTSRSDNGHCEIAARDLMKAMANRFRLNDFDNLFSDMRAVQRPPIAPVMMEPEK